MQHSSSGVIAREALGEDEIVEEQRFVADLSQTWQSATHARSSQRKYLRAMTMARIVHAPSVARDCPRTLVEPARPEPVGAKVDRGAATDADDALLPETGNAAGFLHVLLKAELERAGPEPGRRERIVEEFTKMTSPSHVRAYVERMWHEIVRPSEPGGR